MHITRGCKVRDAWRGMQWGTHTIKRPGHAWRGWDAWDGLQGARTTQVHDAWRGMQWGEHPHTVKRHEHPWREWDAWDGLQHDTCIISCKVQGTCCCCHAQRCTLGMPLSMRLPYM